MPKTVNRLSARTAGSLSKPGRHSDGDGLYLSISPNGGRRWVFIYTRRGKAVELGLGSARLGQVSLAEARLRAAAARTQLRDGVDPLQAKRSSKPEAPTFGVFADELVDDIASGFSNDKHIAQWRSTLKVHAAAIRDLPIDQIGTTEIVHVLKPIWTTLPETASRLRGRIERVLNAAKAKGFREGDNPAYWRGHLDQILPRRQRLTRGHHPALPYQQIPAFFVDLRTRSGPTAAALELLILTASRSNEARGALLAEFDRAQMIWTVPSARMKRRREHRVPLTPAMIDCVDRCLEKSERTANNLIFRTPNAETKLSDSAFGALMERMGYSTITAHGFRSSFRDWCSEQTNFSSEAAEMALAHVISNKTEAAYRRGDLLEKRRPLMEAWGQYCMSMLDLSASNDHAEACDTNDEETKKLSI